VCAGLEGREGFPPEASKLPLDSRIKSPSSVRPTLDAFRRICGKGQMALCEGESCGLARVTSDYRIVPGEQAARQAALRALLGERVARGIRLTNDGCSPSDI